MNTLGSHMYFSKIMLHDKLQLQNSTKISDMNFIQIAALRTSSSIDALNLWIGKTVSWLVLFMVLTTFGIVVMRYAFNQGSIEIQESVIYMHATLFLLASASTLKLDAHVRVDIFYSKMSARGKAFVNLMGNLLLLMPVCIFIFWSSWDYVISSWEIKESSREAGGLPWLFILKSNMLLFAALLILQGFADSLRHLITLISKKSHSTLNTPSSNHS